MTMPEKERIGQTVATNFKTAGAATVGSLTTAGAVDAGSLSVAGTSVLSGAVFNRLPKVAKVALAAADTGGGCFAWANPEAVSIIILRVVIDVTTKSTSAGTLSVGTTATNATTSSANLLDTLDVGAAAGTFDNVTDGGTLGKARQKLAAAKWVTGSKASGALAGLVGSAYIEYLLV